MKNLKNSGIYCIRNIINNKCYIGSAIKLNLRKNQHYSELRRNIHANKRLQNAWNKYGENTFEFNILCYVENKNNLIAIEDIYIKLFKTADRNIGYNIRENARSNFGLKFSEESKKKMSIASKGKPKSEHMRKKLSEYYSNNPNPMKGKLHTKESRLKMSISKQGLNKGVKKSEEHKKKLSEVNLGKHHSEETKIKMSETHKKIFIRDGLAMKSKGEDNGNAKLSIENVIEIKNIILQCIPIKEIAKMFNVTPSCIYSIKRGSTWKNINTELVVI